MNRQVSRAARVLVAIAAMATCGAAAAAVRVSPVQSLPTFSGGYVLTDLVELGDGRLVGVRGGGSSSGSICTSETRGAGNCSIGVSGVRARALLPVSVTGERCSLVRARRGETVNSS